MSRIYDALKEAERLRSKNRLAHEDCLGVMELPGRGCSGRREQEIELMIYGHVPSGHPFYRSAKALRWDANGGLVLLCIPVCEGQNLLLFNNQTSQEEICHIVNVRIRDIETHEVAVTFSSPRPEFWQIPDTRGDIH
jgi:hypothetical protein